MAIYDNRMKLNNAGTSHRTVITLVHVRMERLAERLLVFKKDRGMLFNQAGTVPAGLLT